MCTACGGSRITTTKPSIRVVMVMVVVTVKFEDDKDNVRDPQSLPSLASGKTS